jgi:hypothetical protein
MLVRVSRDTCADPALLAKKYDVSEVRLRAGVAELRERGLVVEEPEPAAAGSVEMVSVVAGSVDGASAVAASKTHRAGQVPVLVLTPAGSELLERLVVARREQLAELFAVWGPEKHERLVKMLNRLARELVPEARPESDDKVGAPSTRNSA